MKLPLTIARQFLLIGAVLLALPIAADLAAKWMNPSTSLGLDVLLYPLYPVLAVLSFAALGWRDSRSNDKSPLGNSSLGGAVIGAALGALWFAVAFLLVAQLHVLLGGRL